MEKETKIKVIIFSGFGAFVLLVILVCVLVTGGKSDAGQDEINTSLRSQEHSDFTIDDMLKSDGRPEYENFTDQVYRPATSPYVMDSDALALQAQLRANQQAAPDSVPKQKKKVVKKKETPPPPTEPEPTNNRFFSGNEEINEGNTIEAIVSGDQKITSGSVIKLITLQEIPLKNGVVLSKGTAIFGVVKLAQDRINVEIQSVRVGNSIYDLKKQVFDRDGLPGIYVPLNIKSEATKEAADAVVSDINVSTYSTDIVSTGVNAVTNAAKSVFRKKNNQIIVTIKSNYKLYLK